MLWRIAMGAALVLYAIFVGMMVTHHEPWADEAQAWQLANYAGIVPLFTRLVHFESSPGLWHLMLKALGALRVSWAGLHWVVAAIQLCAVSVLMMRAPFPWWMRLTIPFSFFLAFQYAVVARSYSLCPLLLFLCAIAWRKRERAEPLLYVGLVLLANTCLYAALISLGLLIAHRMEARSRGRDGVPQRSPWWILLPLAGIAFALWCSLPPIDAPWVPGAKAWLQSGHAAGSGADIPYRDRMVLLRGRFDLFMTALSGGIARPLRFPLLLWALLVAWWYRRSALYYLWPVGLVVLFGTFSRFSIYHQGLVWLLLLFLLWVSWPEQKDDKLHQWVTFAMIPCIAIQMFWTAQVARDEWTRPYAGTTAASPVLRAYRAAGWKVDVALPAVPPAQGIALAFFSVGLQPFFTEQPFANLTWRYWSWPGDTEAYKRYVEDTDAHRVVALVVAHQNRERDDLRRLALLGYSEAHRFCGGSLYPRRADYGEVCYVFLEPKTFAAAGHGR